MTFLLRWADNKMKRLVIMGAILVLAGCAGTETVDARNELQASKAALKTCLAQHPQDVRVCNGASAAYQADLAAYQAISRPSLIASSGGLNDLGPQASPAPVAWGQYDGGWSFAAR
jgi:hypothetical protein